jgi:large subunit ribosomal protein L15
MKLSELKPNKGAVKKAKRKGMGSGSGNGKTSGRGHKGQKARGKGTVHIWFEGGQMPLYRRLPKVGFRSRVDVKGENNYNLVNLATLESIFENGAEVNSETLAAKGYGTNPRNKAGIKVLGQGEISKKLKLKVDAISESARKKIEAAGGSVEIAA